MLTTLLRLLAPFLPFLTEAIYQNLVRQVDAEAPDRLERAFGRSDSLILASDFAEDER